MWNCHQITAYKYSEDQDSVVSIFIYDPNYPDDDTAAIICSPTDVGYNGVYIQGHDCRIVDTNNPEYLLYPNCFGYFDSGYVPKYPQVDL